MKRIFITLTLVLFVVPFGISQDLPSYIPTDGLIAYYPFNGNANDESGNGNHGTVNGATLTNDKYGNLNSAYSFVGSKEQGNSINLGGSIFNDPNSFSISITVNVGELYVHNNPFSYLFSQATGGEIQISQHPNYLGFSSKLNNSSWLTCEITPQINQWVNYVYTYSEELNEIVVYTNGDETCSKEINSTLFSYDGPAMIGRQSNVEHNYFNGTISDIGFWNRALTEQEIQNLYTSSTGDIKLNGVVSAENNQIKNVADPTHSQDVVTKNYTYSKAEVDALINEIRTELGNQIDNDSDGYTEGMGDCDDSDLEVNPAAFEISDDGIDNDCDGQIDELVPNYVPSNGLVAFYPFAGDLEDKSGNEYHLTNSNVSFTDDANLTSNQALYFNGNSSHLYTSKSFSELTSDPNQTISFWFKNISDNWRAIFTIGDSDGGRIVVIPNTINEKIAVIGTDDCHLCGESGGSEGIDIEVNNFRDGWHHIVVSTNSNELKLFLNGNLISTTNHSGFNCDNDNYRLWLGNDIICAPEWFEMNMDDVGIWDRELSAGEINNLYQRN